ncbi:MAG: hypothetical protein HGA53_04765 [Anaerolineaceae bacterium]|nr:hypothetical protein [Anaerolineaceae bacterium]
MILTTIQLAILIILPLLLYYRRVDLQIPKTVLFIAIIYIIWYATYSPLHELRHLLPAVVMNEHVTEIQLFNHFVQGELIFGHITTLYSSAGKEFVILVFPYLTDILFAILGSVVLTKWMPRPKPLIFGVMLTLLVTSPLFDVVNNYMGYVVGAKNDFNAIGYTTSIATSHAIGIICTIVTLGASSLTLWWVLKKQTLSFER